MSNKTVPLVTAVMPTRNRRRFAAQSIFYFLRQDYPHKELIVLDDGEDRVEDVIPSDERIRYVPLDRRVSIGAKRNIGCGLGAGELIAHWDDDDWMSSHRLSTQVDALLSGDADLCGLGELLYYKPDAGEAWLYSNPRADRWLAGGTLLYRRRAWANTRFPDIDIGEDAAFLRRQSVERIGVVRDLSIYIAVIHPGNTCTKRLSGRHWQRRPLEEVSRLFGFDRGFYAGLRNGPPAAGAGRQLAGRNEPVRTGSLSARVRSVTELPLVSCVMPTHNRRRFLPQAIEYFKRQNYPCRELIIVDDGTDAVSDLIPEDPSIRYVRLPCRSSTGAKRNLACDTARGKIVMLWDDDDWYSANRITYQAAPLLAGRADVTGLGNSMVYDVPNRQFWTCTSRLHARMFYQSVVGGTLAFRKKLWGAERFPDISEREDAAFLETILSRGARLERLSNDGVFIYIRHGSNTWRFTAGDFLDDGGWREVEPPLFLSDSDREFYNVDSQTPRKQRLSSRPLVSCILTTANRPRFLRQAIKYALNQTYENKEIIIVDDGEESAEALVPPDDRIKYVRLGRRMNLGEKLNLGIEQSSGDIIQKLDDDDYYHPCFLENTAGALTGHDPERVIAGFDCFLVLIAGTGQLKFSGNGWCAGGTLCFYKKLWKTASFRDVPSAVDWYFLQDHQARHIKLQNPELYILVRHESGHLWTNLGETDVTAYFERKPSYSKSLVDCLPAVDLSFYESLRKDLAAAETRTRQ